MASGRCGGLDIDVDYDAPKFVASVMEDFLGRHRSALAPSQARGPPLPCGDFEALFEEAAAAAELAEP